MVLKVLLMSVKTEPINCPLIYFCSYLVCKESSGLFSGVVS